jgi:hypothetical protein
VTAPAAPSSRREERIEAAKARMRLLLAVSTLEPSDGWHHRAACLGADADMFGPADRVGTTSRGPEIEQEDRARHQRAKLDCIRCHVRTDCLAFALKSGEEGTWGGQYFTTMDVDALRAVKKELGL